jgi:methionyl-tRNA formyltransferase
MGTPEFAVEPLKKLLEHNYNVVGVITSPDKPAGRGQKISMSAVKQFALTKQIPVLQPTNLKDEAFHKELQALQPDLQIVVAFRMLPTVVWKMAPLGTFNLHASLLPQYRGAAPINHAIINGEEKTGLTTFFLDEKIDTGNIILQKEIPITPTENAGCLHDKLMYAGADLLLETVQAIENKSIATISQQTMIAGNTTLHQAPKIFKEDCRILWDKPIENIYNHIRGLSPYPGAFTEIISPEGTSYYIKVYAVEKENALHSLPIGKILTNGKNFLHIAVTNGYIKLQEIQMSGKKKMLIDELLRGFPMNDTWRT